jgi:uncharacterized protein YfaS (alpha-2-macroglobulin family)
MMTPYALYGLLQAEKAGYTIGSETAIERGLQRLDSFIANESNGMQWTDRIFCMYVYSHRHTLKAEWWRMLEGVLKHTRLTDYALALVLELAVAHQKTDLANEIAEALRTRAVEAGGQVHWRTGGFSRWADDVFEVTAVVLKALIVHDVDDPLIAPTISYFLAHKRGNRWNSTKDTALILQALCEYLTRQRVKAGKGAKVAFRCNDGPETEVVFENQTQMSQVSLPGTRLRPGKNSLTFGKGAPDVMYRVVLRHWQNGAGIMSRAQWIEVERAFFLMDRQGNRVRQVNPNEEVPLGSYLECVVTGRLNRMTSARYVLTESPRPSGCEVVPVEDGRFRGSTNTPPLLREDRETLVAFHHEEIPDMVENRCVFLAEMAGTFVVPPARMELMYQTEVRGHSDSFRFRVSDKTE